MAPSKISETLRHGRPPVNRFKLGALRLGHESLLNPAASLRSAEIFEGGPESEIAALPSVARNDGQTMRFLLVIARSVSDEAISPFPAAALLRCRAAELYSP
jgi:hypothetical protein